MEIEKPRKKFEKKHQLKNNNVYQFSMIIVTFFAWIFACVIFRSNSIIDIVTFFSSFGDFGRPFQAREGSTVFLLFGLMSTVILFYKEYNDEHNKNIHFLHSSNTLKSTLTAIAIVTYIMLLGELEGGDFIYFKF
jgi:D-alanyl-lipoteichoic acid acyltransferase DltB (MBOAT superfamily)